MKAIFEFTPHQIEQLHALYQTQWWTKGRSLEDTQRCVEGTQVCIGLVDGEGNLHGFARVVTDYIFKALIFDVIVSDAYRKQGFGDKLMQLVQNHPELSNVKHLELYCLPELEAFYARHGYSAEVGGIRLMRAAGN